MVLQFSWRVWNLWTFVIFQKKYSVYCNRIDLTRLSNAEFIFDSELLSIFLRHWFWVEREMTFSLGSEMRTSSALFLLTHLRYPALQPRSCSRVSLHFCKINYGHWALAMLSFNFLWSKCSKLKQVSLQSSRFIVECPMSLLTIELKIELKWRF